MRLANKHLIITGAARGIGFAIATKCVREGATVGVCDLSPEAVDRACAQLEAAGGRAIPLPADVTDDVAVRQMVRAAHECFGRIDGLVNNAGITKDAQLRNMSDEQWRQVIDVNLTGVFQCTRAVADILCAQGSGAIVSISSVVGLYGNFGQTNYAATKAGVIGMTMTWAKELGRKNVRANAVCPGFINTSILATIPEQVLARLRAMVPMNRLGEPEEVANAVAFLLSDEASFINGVALEVSGGIAI